MISCFSQFLTLFVYSLPCNKLFFVIKVLDLDLFQTPKTFLVIFRTFWKWRPTERKKMYLYYPVPVPQHTCIRPQLSCVSINRERWIYVLLHLINEPEPCRLKSIFLKSSYLSCWIYINSPDNFIDIKFTLLKYVFFLHKCLPVNVS